MAQHTPASVTTETISVSPDAQVAAVKVYAENGALGLVLLTSVIVILLLGGLLWRVVGMFRSLSQETMASDNARLQVIETLASRIAEGNAKLDVLLSERRP